MKSFYPSVLRWLWSVGLGLVLAMAPALDELQAKDSTSPNVAVIVDKAAPQLERYAAEELCGYLDKLYGFRTRPLSTMPASVDAV